MTTAAKSIGRPVDPDRKSRRRREILSVALAQFAEHGFASTDVQEIADQVGVGKGTVYRYFENKEQLFLAAADSAMQELETTIYQSVEGVSDPVEHLRTAACAYAQFFQDRPELVEILIQERATFRQEISPTHIVYRNKNRKAFEDVFRKGVKEGVFQDVGVTEACDGMANLMYGTVVCGCLEGVGKSLVRRARVAIDVYLAGLQLAPRK